VYESKHMLKRVPDTYKFSKRFIRNTVLLTYKFTLFQSSDINALPTV